MEEWKEYKLSEVTSILGDGIHGTPQYDDGGSIYFINGNNLENGHIVIKDNTKRVSYEESLKHQKPLSERTILVSINGTIGNVAKYNGEPCILGKSACYFNVNEDVDLDFIYYVVANNNFKDTITRLATGTTIKNVSLKTMREYSFMMPPIETQKRVSSILKSLDDKIEVNRRINEQLEELAGALFKSWFVDFEPFKDGEFVDCELGMIPKGWKVGTLSDIGEVVGGATPSKSKSAYYTDNGISWITPKDLSINKDKFISKGEIDITELGYSKCSAKIMPRGSVLFSSRAPIGYIAIAKNELCTNQGFKSVVPQLAGTAFIYYYLKNNVSNIESMASGSTFKEASGALMKSLNVIVPPSNILQDFEEKVCSIFDKQESLEEEIHHLTTLRDTLLPKLMSGEIDVNEVKI
ncbi:MAG: restriction endonuclease subunit S [Bacteroidales bacterium]|nr:restriction endonuclease subunit S [Bacteroidales bacterium]